MLIPMRHALLALAIALGLAGAICFVGPGPAHVKLGAAFLALAVVLVIVRLRAPSAERSPLVEDDDIRRLSPERQQELIRGTSLFLREVRYPYSVRLDPRDDRRHFSADVGGVHLGFIPGVMIENATDRQGFGFIAFVHDGQRWRGPGLPCPDDQAAAVRHAAQCVSPLS